MANTTGCLNYYCVKDYGAVGDGNIDDTMAVMAAINDTTRDPNQQGGVLFFSPGAYLLQTITIQKPMMVMGSGVQSTLLFAKNATTDLFFIKPNSNINIPAIVGFQNLTFASKSGQQTAGAYLHYDSEGNPGTPGNTTGQHVINNFYMLNAYTGIQLTGGVGSIFIDKGTIANSTHIGIYFQKNAAGYGGQEQFLREVVIAGPTGSQPAAGIQVEATGDLFISDCDVIAQNIGLNILGGNVYCRDSYFDSSNIGIQLYAQNIGGTALSGISECHFIGCGTTSQANAGVIIQPPDSGVFCDTIDFIGLQCVGRNPASGTPPYNGMVISGGTNIKIANSTIKFFGATSGSGDGISVASAAVNGIIIEGNYIYDPRNPAGNTQYSIAVNSGVKNCLVVGNMLQNYIIGSLPNQTQYNNFTIVP